MKELISSKPKLVISVIGVGGCGCNTVDMLNDIEFSNSVSLVAVNTDLAALNHCNVKHKILIGEQLTNGYGAGADPKIGLKAAKESEETIKNVICDSDVVIITAGFGGGTGTGASPFIAELAKSLAIPCLALVTLPFKSESMMRMNYALEGIEKIKKPIQAYITLSNDLLLKSLDASVGLFSAFTHSNNVLKNLLRGLVEMLTQTGMINVDINDFARILAFEGESVLGVGKANTEQEAYQALDQALNNPLVNSTDISKAQGIIIQVCCKNEIQLSTYEGLLHQVNEKLYSKSALIVAGVTLNPQLTCELEILIIASGITDSDNNKTVEISLEEDSPLNSCVNEPIPQYPFNGDNAAELSKEESYVNIPSIIREQQRLERERKSKT